MLHMNNTTVKWGFQQIFHRKNRFLPLWNPTLQEGSCDVICDSKVDKITPVMSWPEPKLDVKLTGRTQAFIVCWKMKVLQRRRSSALAFRCSLLKPGSHKEINSGVSSPNLVHLKITTMRNKLHFIVPSWPPHTGGHAVWSTNNFASLALFLFFFLKQVYFWPLIRKWSLRTSRGVERQGLGGKFKGLHFYHGPTQNQQRNIREMP